MVNYCSVADCGCNSKTHGHLKFYNFPRDKNRQEQWLKAIERADLMNKNVPSQKTLTSRRVCSRHFHPVFVTPKHLTPDAVPTLKLPGKESDDEDLQVGSHEDIICNSCTNPITGFRYKCITCEDYDLCQKCEMCHAHPQHYMIRMPKPVSFGNAKNLSQNVKKILNAAKVEEKNDNEDSDSGTDVDRKENPLEGSSSDDEPITNYLKRKHDEGIDLSEDVKRKIRKEVIRALETKIEETIKDPIPTMKVTIKGSKKKKRHDNTIARKKKLNEESSFKQTNIVYKIEDEDVFKKDGAGSPTIEEANEDANELLVNYLRRNDNLQEVEFANVSDDQLMTVKNEETPIITELQQPIVSVITDSLSEFLIKKA